MARALKIVGTIVAVVAVVAAIAVTAGGSPAPGLTSRTCIYGMRIKSGGGLSLRKLL